MEQGSEADFAAFPRPFTRRNPASAVAEGEEEQGTEEEEETRGNIGCCEALRCQSKPNLSLWIHDKQRTRMVTKLV